ncbi:MAG: 16S rRNA (guanine(527)-N(7))-methyltransferase RsmG [Suipraeoptans sp.]
MGKIKNELEKLNIEINENTEHKYDKYYELLIYWNKNVNLTAITDYDEVVQKHFQDSLSLINAVDIKKIETVIDIGTGAGFPGIPLKIAFPHLKVTLVDSLNKRINFLNTIIKELELSNIQAIHGRAEDFAKDKKYRESYDLCVSRAVANLSTLSEYCIPYIRVGGIFTPYKTGESDLEISNAHKAIIALGGQIDSITDFNLPNSNITRKIPVIRKIASTNIKYPRKAPLPSKKPLYKPL